LAWYKLILGRVYAFYAILVFVLLLPAAYFLFRIVDVLFSGKKKEHYIHQVFIAWMDVYMPLIFCNVQREGLQHFKQGQTYIVIVNHTSLMDIPVSKPGIPLPNKTLGKISFSKLPIFGYIYKLGSILIDRSNSKSRGDSFAEMKACILNGMSICLYPEGTRNKTALKLLPFHNGAFKLSVETNTAILPAIITGTKNILPANGLRFWAWPHKVHFKFLQAINPKDFSDVDALKQHCFAVMENKIK
jgi:1-acyl-sn-glycerol-3-phosphate acyltransferase